MRIFWMGILFGIGLVALPFCTLKAEGPAAARPGIRLELLAPELGSSSILFDKGVKKKKKKKRRSSPHTLGAGVVFGGATGLGGRAVFKPGIVAIAFDASADRVKTDDGTRVWSSLMKVDGRLYGRGLLDQLVHPYLFLGVGMQRGKFAEETASTAWLGDIGLGAEVKFGRLGINGEAGLMVPVKSAINFRPGVDFYGGVAIMWWLF